MTKNNQQNEHEGNLTNRKKYRIGLLGGTFDPIHRGHIEPAKAVLNAYNLDKILVIPAHIPPHKHGTQASTEHRVNMVTLTCNNERFFELDARETRRNTLSYTRDTVKEIKAENPNSELFFIMGMDSLLTFTQWHCWQDILLHCHLIVNVRPGYSLTKINEPTKQLLHKHQCSQSTLSTALTTSPKTSITTTTIPVPPSSTNINASSQNAGCIYVHYSKTYNISSTEIRQSLINDSHNYIHNSQWLSQEVLSYINKHGLYQKNAISP